MPYFTEIQDLTSLKTEYRRLTMENHPDKGGDNVIMQKIISSYKIARENLENGIIPTVKSEIRKESPVKKTSYSFEDDYEDFDIDELLYEEENYDFVDMNFM